MDLFSGLIHGFSVALVPMNLLFGFLGAVIGTIVGILPGLGPLGAMALLLSLTYGFDPTAGMILFAGIYFGAMYGGSTTSILLNIPGEAASVITVIEGYQMARRGRAGAALAVAAVGSFVAGTISLIGLSFLAPTLATAALKFGPAEYLAVALVGLVIMSRLTGGNLFKSLLMISLGLALGTVGMETVAGYMRYTFHQPLLAQGIDFLPVAMGLFGIGSAGHRRTDHGQGAAAKGALSRTLADAGGMEALVLAHDTRLLYRLFRRPDSRPLPGHLDHGLLFRGEETRQAR